MEEVNCGIDDGRSQVSYDRSPKEFSKLKERNFFFEIQPAPGSTEKEVAVFEIRNEGQVLRRNVSSPFPKGALVKRSTSLNAVNFNVKLTKNGPIDLSDHF